MMPERIWLVTLFKLDERDNMEHEGLDNVNVWPMDSEESAKNRTRQFLTTHFGIAEADRIMELWGAEYSADDTINPNHGIDIVRDGVAIKAYNFPIAHATRTGWATLALQRIKEVRDHA